MSRWYRIAALVAGSVAAACAPRAGSKPDDVPSLNVTHVRIKPERGSVRRIAIEDYVRGTMISEFDPPSGDPATVERMFEVQAVIARTYAAAHLARHSREGFDLCSTSHCQLYQPERLKRSMWQSSIDKAARNTTGQVLWFDAAPARAVFHADCGGHTSAADDVWSGRSLPYLVARKDDGPAAAAHVAWRFEIETDRLISALNRDHRTRVGRQLTEIRITDRDGAGRALRIALLGTQRRELGGEALRSVLTRAFGAKSIRSTKLEVQRTGKTFRFTGSGYGHGVGLCQTGAYARLSAGGRPEQVLARYYPGTKVVMLR